MKRPAFQFYPADWANNAKLRRCTFAERGIWLAVICLFHDSDEYGLLRWPLKDIAQAVGCKVTELKAIAAKGVLKGSDEAIEPLVFIPRHAGKDGEPVTLLSAQSGPLWYSSRMVRDEYIRAKRGEGTRFGATPEAQPKGGIGEKPKGAPTHREGYGPSSSSSSSSTSNPVKTSPPSGAKPDPVKVEIWTAGKALLAGEGMSEDRAGSYLGKLVKDYGQVLVLNAVRDAVATTPAKPSEWLQARCQERRKPQSKQAALEARNAAVADRWTPPEETHAG